MAKIINWLKNCLKNDIADSAKRIDAIFAKKK